MHCDTHLAVENEVEVGVHGYLSCRHARLDVGLFPVFGNRESTRFTIMNRLPVYRCLLTLLKQIWISQPYNEVIALYFNLY